MRDVASRGSALSSSAAEFPQIIERFIFISAKPPAAEIHVRHYPTWDNHSRNRRRADGYTFPRSDVRLLETKGDVMKRTFVVVAIAFAVSGCVPKYAPYEPKP